MAHGGHRRLPATTARLPQCYVDASVSVLNPLLDTRGRLVFMCLCSLQRWCAVRGECLWRNHEPRQPRLRSANLASKACLVSNMSSYSQDTNFDNAVLCVRSSPYTSDHLDISQARLEHHLRSLSRSASQGRRKHCLRSGNPHLRHTLVTLAEHLRDHLLNDR